LQARRASCAPLDTTAIARTPTARSASSATATGTRTPAIPAPAPAATTCPSSHLFQLLFMCSTPSATSTRRSVSRTPRLLTAGTVLSKTVFFSTLGLLFLRESFFLLPESRIRASFSKKFWLLFLGRKTSVTKCVVTSVEDL
jgi:hypothetical protein